MDLNLAEILMPGFFEMLTAVFQVLMPFLLYMFVPAAILSMLFKRNEAWSIGGFLGLIAYFAIEHNMTFNLF